MASNTTYQLLSTHKGERYNVAIRERWYKKIPVKKKNKKI